MTLPQWIAFFLSVFAGGIIPGPISLLAIMAGLNGSFSQVTSAAFGNVAASVLQVLISLFAIDLLASSFSLVYKALLALSGIYLVYIGIDVARSNPFNSLAGSIERPLGEIRAKGFVDTFLITLVNPKAILFFTAFFPSIIPKGEINTFLLIEICVAFSIIALIVFYIYAVFGSVLGRMFVKPAHGGYVSLLLALIFVGLGSATLTQIFH